jgi:hypothetical protein
MNIRERLDNPLAIFLPASSPPKYALYITITPFSIIPAKYKVSKIRLLKFACPIVLPVLIFF